METNLIKCRVIAECVVRGKRRLFQGAIYDASPEEFEKLHKAGCLNRYVADPAPIPPVDPVAPVDPVSESSGPAPEGESPAPGADAPEQGPAPEEEEEQKPRRGRGRGAANKARE